MKPLIQVLQGVLNAREASLRNNRCHVKDLVTLKAAQGRAIEFSRSYPFASDERVRDYCIKHEKDIRLLVPSNTPHVRDLLLGINKVAA